MFGRIESFSTAYDLYHSDIATFDRRDKFNLQPIITKEKLDGEIRKLFKRNLILALKLTFLLAIIIVVFLSWWSSQYAFENTVLASLSTKTVFGGFRLDIIVMLLLSVIIFTLYEMERAFKLNTVKQIKLPKRDQNQVPFLMGTLRFSIGNEGLYIDGGTQAYAARWAAFDTLEIETREIKRKERQTESYEVLKLILKDGRGGKAIKEFIRIPKKEFFTTGRNATQWDIFKKGVEFGIKNKSLNGFN